MKPTQKQLILSYLKQHGSWVHEYKIRAINTDFGWIGARGDRDVRELIKEGKLLTDKDGKYRIVKWKEPVGLYDVVDLELKDYLRDAERLLSGKLKGEKETDQQKLI